MSPDAPTSPPPGSASGLNFFCVRAHGRRHKRNLQGTPRQAELNSGANITCINGPALFCAPVPVQEVEMKKLLAILALSSALVVTAACNTVRGAGRDAQSAANAVDNAM